MQQFGPVTQTVILAAGMGTRLHSAEAGVPKPLLTVGGATLVAHALAHAQAGGCTEAVLVVGYEGARVREAVTAMAPSLTVRFVENPDPSTPNGDSLLAAEPCVAERFFLQMVDHVFAEPVLRRLASPSLDGRTEGLVLVDRDPHDLDIGDATRVRLAGDRVVAIGKAVDPWDAIDAGCFLLTRAVFGALRVVPAAEPRTVSAGMRRLVERESLHAVDIAGVRWADVDTAAERVLAERLLVSSGYGVTQATVP